MATNWYLFVDKSKKDSWIMKKLVVPEEISIDTQFEVCPIENIIVLHCDNRKDDIVVSKGDTWRNNFILHQNLSGHIRGQAATFIDKNGHPIGYIPSFDTREISDKRTSLIESINCNPNYVSVTGNIENILGYVNLINGNRKERIKKEK